MAGDDLWTNQPEGREIPLSSLTLDLEQILRMSRAERATTGATDR
jgi:hypothetical protein